MAKSVISILFISFSLCVAAQNVSLYQQFNGRYDFTFIGNTMNPTENSFQSAPTIFTSSSANLTLASGDTVEAAYLYWAGSGTGDFNVALNSIPLTADRTFAFQRTTGSENFDYFSAFKDITSIVKTVQNGLYTLSELDVTAFTDQHFLIRTNFAGWAIIIVYKNNALPLNQLNVYDGLQNIPIGQVTEPLIGLTITLNSLNVIDNNNAKIGFLAWEGDSGIAVNESLRINGNLISNPPLNPATNAFNGTNSFTNSSDLYNMDLDVYGIQNTIAIGDTSATIRLTSGQDFVMINAVVTKLNSQLPDATIESALLSPACDSRKLTVNYTVKNFNATNALVANTPIAFYANNMLIGQSFTISQIEIDQSENGIILLTIPNSIPNNFVLKLVVDDSGSSTGIVTELVENNNTFSVPVSLLISPKFNVLPDLVSCNLGLTSGVFDFSDYSTAVKLAPTDVVSFYESQTDANLEINAIPNLSNFAISTAPKTIFVKIKNSTCSSFTSFNLNTKNCPPTVYNFVSTANNGNNSFFIDGLQNIFTNFKVRIYNRWGRLIWEGNNNKPSWQGETEFGNFITNTKATDGTYYYILELNDPDYPDPIAGYLYFADR